MGTCRQARAVYLSFAQYGQHGQVARLLPLRFQPGHELDDRLEPLVHDLLGWVGPRIA